MNKQLGYLIQKLNYAGLLILVFLLPWQTRLILRQDTVGYFEISVYAIDLILIILLSISLINANCPSAAEAGKNQKSKIKISNQNAKSILITSGVFLLWNILSIFWADDRLLAMQHVFWLLLAVGLGWMVYEVADIKKIILWFCAGLILPAWLAIWQFVTQSTFANKWLGLAMHKAALGGTSVVETFVNGYAFRWLRAYGSFDHPNILGMMMVAGIIFFVQLFILRNVGCHPERNDDATAGECSRRILTEIPRPRSAPFGMTIFFHIAIVSFAAACFFSFSRSAWLGLLFGAAGIGFLLLRSRLRNKLRNSSIGYNYLKMIIVIIATFLMLGITYKDVLMVRTDGEARLEKKSIDDRALYFQQAKEIIKQHPIVGVGAGNYVEFLKNKNPNNPAWTYQPVHNVFMLIWAELGIVGLLAFVVLYATIIIRTCKSSPLGFCLLLALLPAIFLDHWLWSLHFGLIFAGSIVGFTLNKRLE